ncbi:hypothetical protein DY000_02016608 [Brassica cretica]|uniref:Uncharacterized protein n=1 Tax=Brassica cretica TaxID=69181 RepID=A0ABQ7D5I2_BRACR|nr:hypothetical protein DY000_02016608 [Brassica cretica]
MLELNSHSGSSIYSSQWFACLASHTSRSNSPVAHPSFFPCRDVWTSDAALVGGGSETSGLATQIVWGVGAETFAFDAALEGGGTETDCTSDAAYASCLFMLELNFHSGSSIYSSQWFACLASHTSRSNSPVAHPSFFPCRPSDVVGWTTIRKKKKIMLYFVYPWISQCWVGEFTKMYLDVTVTYVYCE